MADDISKILQEWPYEPGQLTCRFITGDDGMPKVQVRLDLGILQMNVDGRPDGLTPQGFPSLLDYLEQRIEDEDREERATPLEPDGIGSPGDAPEGEQADPRTLSSDECRALRDEAEMYYRRYVAFLVLEDFERVVRDTTRNLRVLDLIQKHAASEEDRTSLEQFRPYIAMMRTRALASQALKDNEPKAAILALDDGLEFLKRYFDETGRPQLFEKSNEVQALRGMRDSLVPKLPVSQKTELRQRLTQALADENYELAAILRDELKQLKD